MSGSSEFGEKTTSRISGASTSRLEPPVSRHVHQQQGLRHQGDFWPSFLGVPYSSIAIIVSDTSNIVQNDKVEPLRFGIKVRRSG